VTTTSFDKGKIKILLLEGIHESAVEAFREDGYSNIEYHPKSLAKADLLAAAPEAHFVGIWARSFSTGPRAWRASAVSASASTR
jgi:D-3-phosphoglycerate dehydrogenase / 2-oxoglutarate reductase